MTDKTDAMSSRRGRREPRPSASPARAAATGVLVLLRDPPIAQRLVRDLTVLGFDARWLGTPGAICGAVRQAPPAVVVFEDRAVGMDLGGFASELRRAGPTDLPVVIVSNLRLPPPVLEEKQRSLAPCGLLLKPFSLFDCVHTLRRFVKPGEDEGAGEGSLTDYNRPEEVFLSLLAEAMRAGRPAAVVRERPEGAVELFVRGNRLLAVVSSDEHEADLGSLLIDEGLVRASHVDWAREELRGVRSDARLGELLTGRCGLDVSGLAACLERQAAQRFLAVLGWRHGTTRTRLGDHPPARAGRVHMDVRPLILAGLLAHGDRDLVRHVLATRRDRAFDLGRDDAAALEALAATEEDRLFLELLASGRLLGEAGVLAKLPDDRAGVWATYIAFFVAADHETPAAQEPRSTTAPICIEALQHTPSQHATIDPAEQARREYAVGYRKLSAGLFAEAEAHFARVVAETPTRGDARAHLAWCQYRALDLESEGAEAAVEQVIEGLRGALQCSPQLGIAYDYLGCVYRDRSDLRRAATAFLKALEADPGNTEALENLRRLHRPPSGEQPAAVLGRIRTKSWQARVPPPPLPPTGPFSSPAVPENVETRPVDGPPPPPSRVPIPSPAASNLPVAPVALVVLEWSDAAALDDSAKGRLVHEVHRVGATLEEFGLTRLCAVVGFPRVAESHQLAAAVLATAFLRTLEQTVVGRPDAKDRLAPRIAIRTGQVDPSAGGDALGELVAEARRQATSAGDWRIVAETAPYRGFEGLVDLRPLAGRPDLGELRECMMADAASLSWSGDGSFPSLPAVRSQPRMAAVSRGPMWASIAPGTRLGGFEVEAFVGAGGMGEVYRARDVALARLVAVKVMRPDALSSPLAVRRFQREAQALAALNCPNVTQIYSLSLDAEPPYLAMEYVDGPALRQVLEDRCCLPLAEALDVFSQTVEGLDAVYRRGLIHRDVNPKNLLLDRHGTVKITDFGLVKMELAGGSLSGTSSVVGTPLYLSPEQARGQDVDFRTDLYSLGITLFHLLAGRPPFWGRTVIDIVTKHVMEPMPSLASFGVSVPAEVEELVQSLTAKQPDQRPASYDEVARLAAELLADCGEVRPPRRPFGVAG